MNKYLARLKGDTVGNPPPRLPSKPSKAAFEPFEGNPTGRIVGSPPALPPNRAGSHRSESKTNPNDIRSEEGWRTFLMKGPQWQSLMADSPAHRRKSEPLNAALMPGLIKILLPQLLNFALAAVAADGMRKFSSRSGRPLMQGFILDAGNTGRGVAGVKRYWRFLKWAFVRRPDNNHGGLPYENRAPTKRTGSPTDRPPMQFGGTDTGGRCRLGPARSAVRHCFRGA
jgi:hypothetical protein